MEGDAVANPEAKSSEENNTSMDAFTMLAQGKRHLLVRDYSEAVSCLGQACGLLAEKYGDQSDECGEACLYYGKALLELARSESEVLGDAIEDEGGDRESDDEDEGETDKESAMEQDEGEEADAGTEAGTEAGASTKAVEGSAEGEADSSGTAEANDQADDDDKGSNLKLAWEVLELAKLIFQRNKDNVQMNLKLAETYFLLGAVSLESEMYQLAIEDTLKCLEIQKQHLMEDDRKIAETHYILGTAYGLNNEFDLALQEFSKALALLEVRIKNLELKKASGEKPEESDAFYTIEGEIKELSELIPDLREKIAEHENIKVESMQAFTDLLRDVMGCSKREEAPKAKEEPKTSVSNISHLVRKKQKVDSVPSTEASSNPASSSKE